ncbi:MAG: hypothetical protein ACFFG0_09255 [Candidatus Thorarchaeota archaeon]
MNEDELDTVTISVKEYNYLWSRDRVLQALEAGGVDNWEWYSDSINKWYPEYFDE